MFGQGWCTKCGAATPRWKLDLRMVGKKRVGLPCCDACAPKVLTNVVSKGWV